MTADASSVASPSAGAGHAMNQRTLIGRLLSPAGFGLVLLLLLLPFLAVSCGSGEETAVGTFTGIDMVIGGEPDLVVPAMTDEEAQQAQQAIVAMFHDQIDAQPLAILATLVMLLAMAAGLVRERMVRHGLSAGLAVLATALLAGAVARAISRIEEGLRNIAEQPETAAFDVSLRYGFWLCVAVLAALAVGHALALVRAWRAPAPAPAPAEAVDGDPPPDVEVRAEYGT
jgi:hypothetical protein